MDRELYIAAHVAVRQGEPYLLDRRRKINLVDVGLSERDRANRALKIRFHVAQRLTEPQLESAEVDPLPDEIAGFPREVNERSYRLSGQQWWFGWGVSPTRGRSDPLLGGISISNDRSITAGTLGAVVRDRSSNERLILSNFHVLANGWATRSGAPRILQPGRLDGGTPRDAVGAFQRHAMDAYLDAAVARLDATRGVSPNQFGIGAVRGRVTPFVGQRVTKHGRTTGRTDGVVTAVAGSGRFTYSGVSWLIRSIVAIDPPQPGSVLSGAGDSGSCWLDVPGHRGVALHFAGSDQPERALALDLGPVCDTLGVELLS